MPTQTINNQEVISKGQTEVLRKASSKTVYTPRVAANFEKFMVSPSKIKQLSDLPKIETGDETASSIEDSEDDGYNLLAEIDDTSTISGNSSGQLS